MDNKVWTEALVQVWTYPYHVLYSCVKPILPHIPQVKGVIVRNSPCVMWLQYHFTSGSCDLTIMWPRYPVHWTVITVWSLCEEINLFHCNDWTPCHVTTAVCLLWQPCGQSDLGPRHSSFGAAEAWIIRWTEVKVHPGQIQQRALQTSACSVLQSRPDGPGKTRSRPGKTRSQTG